MATIPINDTAPRIAYTATAGQTVFPYPFWISAEEDIIVYQNGTALTLTTDYTVSDVLEPTGGDITLVTGASVNDSIVIVRDIPVKRTSEFQTGGSFQASVLNASLSKQVAMIQQVENNQSRSLQLNPYDTFTGDMELPTISASKYLKVKEDASGWEMASAPVSVGSSITPAGGDAHKIVTVNADEDNLDILAGVGTSGQVLTSNGSAVAPSWQDAAGGALVFISETTISGSPASVDITSGIDSTYDTYLVDIVDLIPATDAATLYFRVTTDGGSTFKSGASDYGFHSYMMNSGASTYSANAINGHTEIWLGATLGNGASDSFNLQMKLHNPSSTSNHFSTSYLGTQKRTITDRVIGGAGIYQGATTAVNGFQLLMGSGNLSSGTIRLYGIAKS